MTDQDIFTAANVKMKRLESEIAELKEKLARAEELKRGAEAQAARFLHQREDLLAAIEYYADPRTDILESAEVLTRVSDAIRAGL